MLLTQTFAILILLLPSSLRADSSTDCVDGIYTVLSEFTFNGSEPGDYWGNVCTNTLSVHSLWAAAKTYCTLEDIIAGQTLLQSYCTEYGLIDLVPYDDILPDLTDLFISSLTVVEFGDVDATKVWDTSVLISASLFEAGEKTTTVFEQQYALHQKYGWAIYGFWGSVLLVGMVNRVVMYLFGSRYHKVTTDLEHTTGKIKPVKFSTASVAWNWFKTNLIIPAAFGSHHQRLLWGCTIPTRLVTVVITAYWILNLVLGCISYEFFWPNLYYSVPDQKWRYIADRTGVMSYANLAVIWMFSGRNNIFLWLTGWDFSTFNIFHRNVARIATAQAIVHSVAYTVLVVNEGELAESWTENYWYMGGIATISMSLLLVSSSILLRKHCYEVFLLLHIVFSVLTIVALFYHTFIFDGEYDPYLWPLVAIWGFDRLARIVRQIYCNLHVTFSKDLVRTTTSTVTYDQPANLIRLEISPGSTLLEPAPGQHYFLYQPLKWNGWENHPFTLSSWTTTDSKEGSDHMQAENLHKDTTTKLPHVSEVPGPNSSKNSSIIGITNTSQSNTTQRTKLTFLIRPHSSWTQRLRTQCLTSPTHSIQPKMFIEGPYGHTAPLHTFNTVLFVVGGTGISAALPYLQDHLCRISHTDRGTRVSSIRLIWSTKQEVMIKNLIETELAGLLGREDVQMTFHVTDKSEGTGTESLPVLGVRYCRPDIPGLIAESLNDQSVVGGNVAVFCCGPAGMADTVRRTVHQQLVSGGPVKNIEYFEESFGW